MNEALRKDSEAGYMYNIKDVVVFEKLDRILAICLDPEAYILLQKASSFTDQTIQNFNLGLGGENVIFLSQRSRLFNQKISKAEEEIAKAKSITKHARNSLQMMVESNDRDANLHMERHKK